MAHATETSVKWFHSGMQGAPYPSGIGYGDLTSPCVYSIFKACLVDGFNSRTFDSISVTNGVARATRAAGHGFAFDQIVKVSGATPSGLNGDKRVLVSTSTYIEFDATGISDGNATGTIAIMTAPAGWEAPFYNATDRKLVVRSPNTNFQQSFYRLYDHPSYGANQRTIDAYAEMTSVDSGTGQWHAFVAEAQGWAAPVNNVGNASYSSWLAGQWMIIADSATAWYWCLTSPYVSQPNTVWMGGFGAFKTFLPNDVGNNFCMAGQTRTQGLAGHCGGGGLCSALRTDYISRSTIMRNAAGQLASNGAYGYGASNINAASGWQGPTFPSPVDNGLMLCDSLFRETLDGSLRGKNRGLYWCMQDRPLPSTCPGSTVTGVSGLDGRTLMLVTFSPTNATVTPNPAQDGRIAVDITGPWEY